MKPFLVDMEALLVWTGPNAAHFRNAQELWAFLTSPSMLAEASSPAATSRSPRPAPEDCWETVEQALARGVQITKCPPDNKLNAVEARKLRSMDATELLDMLGLGAGGGEASAEGAESQEQTESNQSEEVQA